MKSPAEIARYYVDIGSRKVILPFSRLFVLSLFAGAFIAMGGFASTVASFGAQPAFVGRLLGALVFPIGLMLVLVAGAELFTGNCLIIAPVLQHRATVKGMLYNWGVVYLGNFLGALLVAFLVSITMISGPSALYGGALAPQVISVAVSKVTLSVGNAFVRGILCNLLVCLAVWVSFSADDIAGKIGALYLPVFLFVLCGFEHCIANMYFIPLGIFTHYFTGLPAEGLNWLTFILRNLIPVTLGNIVGGGVLVGMGYWSVYLRGHKEHP